MTETFDRQALKAELARDESTKPFPYRDSLGHLTIGVGHNLDAKPLPADVIELLLDRDIDDAITDLNAIEPRWIELTPDRQRVLLNMAFNLGRDKLLEFHRMWEAISDFLEGGADTALDRAAREMLESRWAAQVKSRALRLAARFVTVKT